MQAHPDGTCEPVRNLASLHHDVDDAMYDRDRPSRHGLARGTGALGGALGRGREIAHLRMMGLAPRGDGAPAAVASPEHMDPEARPRRPRERIARETGPAGPAMPGYCPGMDGAAPPGAGEAS